MAARTFAIATALMLGLTGLAQGQGRPAGQEPGQARGADSTASPTPGSQSPATQAQATQAPVKQAQATRPQAEPPRRAAAPRRARTAQRPREHRSARYQGGGGASWRTGRDAYGFMGTYGGCSYRGHAGPGGYRLDERC